MYEAAAAYFEATGKTSLLDIAEKNASLLLSVFGKDNLLSYPFHPEIELPCGMVRINQHFTTLPRHSEPKRPPILKIKNHQKLNSKV